MNRWLKIISAVVIIGGIWCCLGLIAEEKTDSETMISETVVFEKCNHKATMEYPIPENATRLSGKNAAKSIKREYQDFENNYLYVKSVSKGYCEKHFKTFLDGNSIRTVVIMTGETVSEYPTAPSQFSEKDIDMLKRGIVTDSPEELSVLLEDYTS